MVSFWGQLSNRTKFGVHATGDAKLILRSQKIAETFFDRNISFAAPIA